MSWRIGDHGFVMTLDERVPRSLEKEAPAFVRDLLRAPAIDRDRVRAFAVHPGGKRILDSVSRALGGVELDSSRSVLRDFGNMSAATVLFVLERMLPCRRPGRYLLSALGPGFTAGFQLLHVR
jgi:alkylresorcinol/alkylpyrone synthase